MVNSRELSKDTARVLTELPEKGPCLITRNGIVAGILVPPSGQGIETDVDLLARLRMAQAFRQSQAESVLKGTDDLTMEEIDAEIRAAREERKLK